jgi:hypothetical protein
MLGSEALAPCRYPDRYVQRSALAFDLDLDGVQPPQSASGDDLAASLVRAGQHHQQLAPGGVTDAIEAAQLCSEGLPEVGERLRGELLAVSVCELLHIVEAHKQAAERGAMTTRSVDLLVQTRRQFARG